MTDDTPELGALRERVREWCARSSPPDWERGLASASDEELVAFQREWHRTLRDGGYLAPHWPTEWGGAGLGVLEQAVLYEEMTKARVPRLTTYFISLYHVPATLLAAGTDEQRRRYLPGVLDGEIWCQGFSEPGAGSDLASLKTRAVRDGDVYVVNGQKLWSSLAHHADFCLLLARTDPSAPKRKGISYFILDMRSPGVEVRPIRTSTGGTEFCEIFLTDVRIPVASLIGPENQGWKVAQQTLANERSAIMVEQAARMRTWLDELLREAHALPGVAAGSAAEDGHLRQELARAYAGVEIFRLLARRMIESVAERGGVGPEASVIKIFYSELLQWFTELGVRLQGAPAQLRQAKSAAAGDCSGVWLADFIQSWQWTIAGGTNEIQRSIIGERALDLPREPGLD